MQQKLKELFMSKINLAGKKPIDISSYTLIRAGTGSWNNKIYWKGKLKEKSIASIIVNLNNDIDTVKLAINAMEEIITIGSRTEIDFGQKIKTEKGKIGW